MSPRPFKRSKEFQSVDDFSAFLETLDKAVQSETPGSSPKKSTTERVADSARLTGALIIAPLIYAQTLADRFEARFIEEPPTYDSDKRTVGQIREYCQHNDGGLAVNIADSWKR